MISIMPIPTSRRAEARPKLFYVFNDKGNLVGSFTFMIVMNLPQHSGI